MSETDATAPLETAPRRRLAVSTALFAIATGLSRIVGVLREIVAAAFFGVQGSISAFTVAFQVPNLVRALVADSALGAAFVPVFNDLLQRGERERAWRVASSVFWLSFVGLSAVTLVFEVLAPQVMARVRLPQLAGGRARTRAVPDAHPVRPLGRRELDAERVRRVLRSGDRAGGVERRDHRRAGGCGAVLALDRRPPVRLRDRNPPRHGRPVRAAAAMAARPRRPLQPHALHRRIRSCDASSG